MTQEGEQDPGDSRSCRQALGRRRGDAITVEAVWEALRVLPRPQQAGHPGRAAAPQDVLASSPVTRAPQEIPTP